MVLVEVVEIVRLQELICKFGIRYALLGGHPGLHAEFLLLVRMNVKGKKHMPLSAEHGVDADMCTNVLEEVEKAHVFVPF